MSERLPIEDAMWQMVERLKYGAAALEHYQQTGEIVTREWALNYWKQRGIKVYTVQ